MKIRALIFDIGGTVFDWHTAIVEAAIKAIPPQPRSLIDLGSFAYGCRDKFLTLNSSVMKGDTPWMTSDQMLAAVMAEMCTEHELLNLSPTKRDLLDKAWRDMPAWPGAREGIAALRQEYIVAPLTILSWPMAVGSSRRNGIQWDSIFSCDVLGVYKPDPRCYARAAQIIDCAQEELMMVAAHPSDLRAAMKCGYRSAYVLPRLEDPGEDYSDTGFAAEFDIIAKDFPELAKKLLAA
jgi:2-haloacid dehalogenase